MFHCWLKSGLVQNSYRQVKLKCRLPESQARDFYFCWALRWQGGKIQAGLMSWEADPEWLCLCKGIPDLCFVPAKYQYLCQFYYHKLHVAWHLFYIIWAPHRLWTWNAKHCSWPFFSPETQTDYIILAFLQARKSKYCETISWIR